MEFEIEPLIGCNFLIFGEKRQNIRIMLDNKWDKEYSNDEKDYYDNFTLIFEDDKLASIEFVRNGDIKVVLVGTDIINMSFKEAYEYLKQFDNDISLIDNWNRAISEKLGIIISGCESDEFENEDIVCLSVMKNGYITKSDFDICYI